MFRPQFEEIPDSAVFIDSQIQSDTLETADVFFIEEAYANRQNAIVARNESLKVFKNSES